MPACAAPLRHPAAQGGRRRDPLRAARVIRAGQDPPLAGRAPPNHRAGPVHHPAAVCSTARP
eukprot:CAMPEP_0172184438 /NCGR_PEP_ID=MMETSP1050-20130122/19581_1 /TAXON_ID=233186 /ORGANISM="Cryptomonas curvata, Strain CCAP979/52" /LENGTH=61 /DNA_ID=CAMNT_0012858247 /DNA_START=755 /DNA_END=936 /DNA_ORIENTATION=+